MNTTKTAIVLLSGGLDSATCLAVAKDSGFDVIAVSFLYGQKHSSELNAAKALAEKHEVKKHVIFPIDVSVFSGSSLTDASLTVPTDREEGIPNTYVPARNTIFLSVALGFAEVYQADAIYIGANAVDYSGYPDCRPEYISAFGQLANLATKRSVEGAKLEIMTPLINLTKARIISLGTDLGVDYALTVSCYNADEQGLACGKCDSCYYRRQGFETAGVADPTRYQT